LKSENNNIIYLALLKDENKRTVGVLHLINKHYSQVISEEDEVIEVKVRRICLIIFLGINSLRFETSWINNF